MNATLKLLAGQTPEYEAGLNIRFQEWMGVAKKYREEFTDKDGNQEHNQFFFSAPFCPNGKILMPIR